jgi:hypothetical protein
MFTLKHINKIMIIIVLLFINSGAQNISHASTSLSFVVLPLRTTQSLQMEGEQFLDEFIKVIRMQGHNAVSTRYLKSVFLDSRFGVLEACTTQVCMSQLVRLVGTRFLLHGSLSSDSGMDYVINLKIIDVPNNKILTEQCEHFTQKNGLSPALIEKFTNKVLNIVTATVIGSGGEPFAIQSAAERVETPHTDVVVPPSDTVEKKSDSSTNVPGSAEVNQILIVDSLVEHTSENLPDTSKGLSNVDSVTIDSTNVLSVKNIEKDSARALDTTVELSVSTPPPVILTVPLQEYQSSGPTAPPEALKRENVRKKLKIVRVSTFGAIALAAFSGGIEINSLVKKSLGKEKVFFNDYMKADESRADAAYQAYLLQTEKTDARIRQRSFLYTLGLLGLAGCAVSLKF